MYFFMYGYSVKIFKNTGYYSKINCCSKQYHSTKCVYILRGREGGREGGRERERETDRGKFYLRALSVAKLI
jgi:hypothetical protein